MALIEIQYGSEASSTILNENFNFLLQKVQSLASVVEDNKTALNTKANDSDVVHISGNESIVGRKTFIFEQYSTNDTAEQLNLSQPRAEIQNRATYNNIVFHDNIGTPISILGSVQTPYNNGGIRFLGWNAATNSYTPLFYSTIENPARYITETYHNGASWYRVYSDGWCEQGASSPNIITGNATINFLRQYRDYNIFLAGVGFTIDGTGSQTIASITPSGFTTASNVRTCSTNWWMAAGYIS